MNPEPRGPGAPPPDYGEDGVDLTLVRWYLSLTPRERLEVLEDRVADLQASLDLNERR